MYDVKLVIAQFFKRHDDKTLIKPIYLINENEEVEKVGPFEVAREKFPNKGTVLVWGGRDVFEYKYEKDELFLIGIEESRGFDESKENSSKYQSYDGGTSTIEKLPLLVRDVIKFQGDTITLPYSGHKFVFIDDGQFVYGPYSIRQIKDGNIHDQDDGEENYHQYNNLINSQNYEYFIEDLNYIELGVSSSFQNVIHKFNKSDLNGFLVENWYGKLGVEYYIHNAKLLLKKNEPLEYILDEPDQDIIKWADRFLPKKLTKEELDSRLLPIDANDPIQKLRFERYTSLKEKNTNWIDFIDSFLKEKYLNTEEGQVKLNLYIQNNAERLIKEKGKEIEERAALEKKEITEELERLQFQVNEQKEHLEKLSILKRQLEDEAEAIVAKSAKLHELEEAIKNKAATLDLLGKIENAKKEYENSLAAYTRISNDVQNKQKELKNLQNEVAEESQKRLKDLYFYVKAITENYELRKNKESELKIIDLESVKSFSKRKVELRSYFKEVQAFLESNNRFLSEVEVINLVTCLHQNFLTIFVGLPGVGKTSLANLMSSFICSREMSIEVPVGRGWTSKKNLLGFYNSLRAEYQSDEFGIIDRLKDFNKLPELLNQIPFIITLDEANLSSIEHYWSDFISQCDKEIEREIKLIDADGNCRIRLPDGFKFIFTVNHDHTTELLSPRLLDRACIIKLTYNPLQSKNYFPQSISEEIQSFESYYSQESIRSAFIPVIDTLSIAEEKTLDDILEIISDRDVVLGKQISVSPRKIKSIRQYCSVVREPFKELNGGQLLGLDFAILQFILPLINGQGSNFENRLNKLKDELQRKSLTKSAQEVEDILKKGRDFQYFSYFT